MKRKFKKCIILVCIVCFIVPALVCINDCRANEVYDESQAIERDSKNAQNEADKGNYEGAREEAGKGFDTPTNPPYNSNEYDIPMPGEPQVDNE